MNTQHAAGYTCHMCGVVAVEAMITFDLRAEEPTVTVSIG